MSESDGLIAVLRRVRRRLRLRRALDAAVLGGTVTLAVAALLAALQLGRPGDATVSPWAAQPVAARLGLLLAAAMIGGALGAIAALARQGTVELSAAATAVDRWLARQAGAAGDPAHGHADGDRARVALALADSPSRFARAAVADAAERAGVVPVREAAPLRRPRRLGALAMAAACGLVAVLAPVLAPTAATGRRSPATVADPAVAGALSEVEAIGRAARARGDDELAALADELGRWLARAAKDAPAGTAATDEELAAIAARARRSAEEGAQSAAVLARVAAALAGTDASRELGQAFARMDAEGIARQARTAGAAGSAAALAGALARAAAAARDDAGSAEPRRLSGLTPERPVERPGSGNPAGGGEAPAGPSERRLQRLERDLRESADACAADPERCRRELDARAADLAAPARDAAGADAREQLSRAAERMRGGRGESGAGRGQSGHAPSGAAGPGQASGPAQGQMQGQTQSGARSGARAGRATVEASGAEAAGSARSGGSSAAGGAETEAAAAAARRAFEQAARGTGATGSDSAGEGAGDGTGSGDGAGGEAQAPGAAGAGPRVELSIPEGAGPTRAEAIRTGAGRGFAQPGYGSMFRDYQAAMEDGLEHTEIPAERRQLVRRYFELIRPR